MKKIALLLSAGKQTRFEDATPKALAVLPDGEQLLRKNINNISKYVDEVYVAVGQEDMKYYRGYERHLIPIQKGGGCGHAVFQAMMKLKKITNHQDYEIILIWGDSLHTTESYIFDEISKHIKSNNIPDHHIVVPVVVENNPYMLIAKNALGRWVAKYSKYGEISYPVTGFHDTGVFIANSSIVQDLYDYVIDNYDNTNRIYTNKESKEFEFLYLLDKYCKFVPIVLAEDFKIKSFNTKSELNNFVK